MVTANATYNVLLISGQCWLKENLNEPSTTPCGATINTGCNIWNTNNPGDIGSWGYYNAALLAGTRGDWSTSENAAGEGLLYQWSAAMNGSTTERAQGVCPSGWHIPSDCEWMYLEHGLGMSVGDQTASGTWRNSGTVGSDLSSLSSSGTNSSGFTGLLSGNRTSDAYFNLRGSLDQWYSSTQSPMGAYSRAIRNVQTGVLRQDGVKTNAYSIRCLKD